MNQFPQVPGPQPSIPKGWLLTTLAVPPLVTLFGNTIASFYFKSNGDEKTFLGVMLAVFFVILGNLPFFNDAVAKRYRGRSLAFLNFSYFFGQVIICLSLWLGSGFLLFK
ncbi:MAG: hypothetical protein ACRDBP_12005 [Luteolibacter sp.]